MEEKTTVVGVDIAKTVFETAVSDVPGRVSRPRRLPRSRFLSFFPQLAPARSAGGWGTKQACERNCGLQFRTESRDTGS